MAEPHGETEQTVLEEVEIHEMLGNERRQLILRFLKDQAEGRMGARALADRIAEVETDESPPPPNLRKSVYITLTQNHLPKLDRYRIVDYDEQSKRVALAERSSEVWVYMETVPKYGISWSEYYLGTACLGLLLVVATWIGVPLIADVGTAVWAVVVFLLIGGAGVYQTIQQESSIWHRLRSNLD